MLFHPHDSTLFLVEQSDVDGELPEHVAGYRDRLGQVFDWAREYLCRPHAELGRSGNVCPFAQPSLDRGRFYLSVFPGQPADADEAAAVVKPYRDWFLDLAPRSLTPSQLTTILVLFPDVPEADVSRTIDGAQELLKTEYVQHGLMVGEFHAGPPPKGGLWNPDFRPLRSPVPLLAIRHMVPTDFPFLVGNAGYVRAYLELFSGQVPKPLREVVRQTQVSLGLEAATP